MEWKVLCLHQRIICPSWASTWEHGLIRFCPHCWRGGGNVVGLLLCVSQFIHHGQQLFSFAAARVFRKLLLICCKLSSNPGQFCSSTFILRGEENKRHDFCGKSILKKNNNTKNVLIWRLLCRPCYLDSLNIYHFKHGVLSSTCSSPVEPDKQQDLLEEIRNERRKTERERLTPPPPGLWGTEWSWSHFHFWQRSPPSCCPSDEPAGSAPLWPAGSEFHPAGGPAGEPQDSTAIRLVE